jgi:hypothetical protein
MTRLDWEKSKARDAARAAEPDYPLDHKRPASKTPFALTYAQYVKRQKDKGLRALPPLAWIKSMRGF